jgi:hypothetical protein
VPELESVRLKKGRLKMTKSTREVGRRRSNVISDNKS